MLIFRHVPRPRQLVLFQSYVNVQLREQQSLCCIECESFQFLPGISFKAHQNVDCSSKSGRLFESLKLQSETHRSRVFLCVVFVFLFLFLNRCIYQSTLLLSDCESTRKTNVCWCTASLQQQKQ